MEVKVVDDFLSPGQLKEIQEMMIFNQKFPFHFSEVTNTSSLSKEYWNWYANHLFYEHERSTSDYFKFVYDIFIPRLREVDNLQSLMRIKGNFYPYTSTLKEHDSHIDYEFTSRAAIFCVNTCDGFTRLDDGSKIDSVENRIFFFDGSKPHNSSTTTTAAGRFNINFNYI